MAPSGPAKELATASAFDHEATAPTIGCGSFVVLPMLCCGTSSTRISRHINAPRADVYRALLDARAVAAWKVPTGMTSHVHAFDACEGGSLRISLPYDAPIE